MDAAAAGGGSGVLHTSAGASSKRRNSLPVPDGVEPGGSRGTGAGSFPASVPVSAQLRTESEVYYLAVSDRYAPGVEFDPRRKTREVPGEFGPGNRRRYAAGE